MHVTCIDQTQSFVALGLSLALGAICFGFGWLTRDQRGK